MSLLGDFFDSVGDAVSTGAEAIGNAVESAVNTVAEVGADAVETVGNAAQDVINAVGDGAGEIPIAGGFLKGAAAWLGSIVAGVANFTSINLIKGALGIIGGALGGSIKILGGILSLNGELLIEGLNDSISTFLGALIATAGSFLSVVQSAVPFLTDERALTQKEKDRLAIVFQDSLALYNIRLKYNSGAPTTHFTLNNVIYCTDSALNIPFPTLVHECVHVWQYQNKGTRYLFDALRAQAEYGRSGAGNAYDWIAEVNRGNTAWEDFNAEAQAKFIEEVWSEGELQTIDLNNLPPPPALVGNGVFYDKQMLEVNRGLIYVEKFVSSRDLTDHSALAILSVRTLRTAWNVRLSRLL